MLLLIAFGLVSAPAVQITAAKPEGEAAHAVASLPALFSTDDYPIEAIMAEEQGTVAVTLQIGPSGKVTDCTVTQSASPSLDAKTCSIITERAVYQPARDRRGRPIAGSDRARIRWMLPDAPETRFANAWTEVSALVPVTGPNQCTVRTSEKTPPIDQRSCDMLVNRNATFRPATIGQPFVMTIRQEQSIGEGIPPLLSGSGLARVIVRQHIDPEGSVTSCERVPDLASGVDDTPYFNCRINARYGALPDTETNRSERLLTIVWMRSFNEAPASK